MDDPEAIAIVGVGCRLPGAGNLDEFWRVLSNGENHVIDIPKDRWNLEAFYDADPDAPGKTYVRKVGIVKDHDKFDNRLFDVNDIEAAKMDPQQRFVLESTYMAMENGGFTRAQMSGSNTGVFMGLMNCDYTEILAADMDQADNYTLTGGAASIAAARISYVFNLLGPALSIDTACSSALIAIHLAIQALRTGDCKMAICGGVNCIMLPSVMIPLSKARMVSPTGSSKAFSAEADGYARGEGCGIVLLKKYSEAIANGDRVWAIIKTASNQDGRMASPITAPSGIQQQSLLKETYPRYNINHRDVQVIEAHGTGTPVGDPIEANSLGTFFGGDGKERFIGSVKTNIGHLESAAGIAGLVKVLLMMKNGTVVPSLHFVNPNPKIDFEKFNLTVPRKLYPWNPLPNGTRMACVNSFGFGGSNGHAIVIQPPIVDKQTNEDKDGHIVIAISGHSKPALKANVVHLAKSLSEKELDLRNLSYTSTCRRDHYNHRLSIPIFDDDDVVQKLKKSVLGNFDKYSSARKKIEVVYVFGGMGTSWPGMCKEIMATDVTFLQNVRDVDNELKKHCSLSMEEEILKGVNYGDPLIGPLLLFTCQVALFSLWESWGIQPTSIVGQSVGEVAAAYASGRLSLEQAVMVIFHRTELLTQVTGGQMMVILNYPVTDVEELCKQYGDKLNIAVYYSPNACSISGDADCVQKVKDVLESEKESSERDISLVLLKVTTAFHSQRMDQLITKLEQRLKGIIPSTEHTRIFSTVTGKAALPVDFVTPNYWAKNLRQSVLFHQALAEAKDPNKHTVFVEIGPKPVLRAHLEAIFGEEGVEIIASMEKGSDIECMLNSVCELHALGLEPAWDKIVPQRNCEVTDEPKYQFQRTKALYEPDISRKYRDGTGASIQDHPFVNRVAGDTPTFRIDVNERQTPFVYEHVVNGVILVPGAFYAEVALVVGSEILRMPPQTLSVSAHYIQPLSVQPGQEHVLMCQVQKITDTSLTFTVFKQNSIYAHGHAEKRDHKMNSALPVFSKLKSRCKNSKDHDQIYNTLAKFGFQYGDGLSILRQSFSNTTECIASIQSTDLINSQIYQTHFHPSVLDAMTQAISTIAGEDGTLPGTEGKTVLPAGLGSVSICQSLDKHMLCYAKIMKLSKSKFTYNLLLMTTSGALVAEVQDFVIKVVGENSSEVERVAYKLIWAPAPQVGLLDPPDGNVIITICDDNALVTQFKEASDDLNFKVCKTTAYDLDIDEVKDALFIRDSSNTLILRKDVNSIVFHQGAQLEETEVPAHDAFEKICQACDNIRQLLICLSEHDLTIPVSVLTRSTQSGPSVNKNNFINIFGSQLWGMVRSIMKEDLYPNVQLIDISDTLTETVKTFVNQIVHHKSSSALKQEVMISKGVAYTSAISFSREIESSLLAVEQKWNGVDEVRLVQDPKSSADNMCLQPYNKLQPQNGHARVTLHKILLHKDSLFPKTLAGGNQIWRDINTEEPQLICLEGEGSKKTLKGFSNVIICLPTRVANVVDVPPDCVIDHSAIPCYQTGLMTLLILTWNIYETLEKVSHTYIVTDKVTLKMGALMKNIFQVLGKEKTECILNEDLENIQLSNPSGFVFLADLELHELGDLMSSPKLQQIVSIQGCSGDSTAEACLFSHTQVEILAIEPKKIFHLSQLTKSLRKIVSKVAKNREKFETIFKNIDPSYFSVFSDGSLDFDQAHNLKLISTTDSLFRQKSSYIVVGGLGGLGWLTVCLIAEMGGGLVATLSRSPPKEEKKAEIEEVKRSTGAEIVCLQADISDQVSLQKAFNILTENYSDFPLKGIFQGAGILDDAFAMRMTKENFDRVCMPKILGTYNLHQLSLGHSLDYFVMHSSIVSIAGNPGQSNYGAGNSFMDTFAHYRRSKGLPGQSINWGPLELGMALNNEQIAQQLLKAGFVSLNKEQIEKCLIHTLLTNVPQICFMDFDWMEKQRHLYLSPDIRPIMMNRGKGLDEDDEYTRQIDLAEVKMLPPQDRFQAILDYTKEVIGQVLAMDSDDLQKETILSSLGLDSMLAMTLVNQIRRDLYVRVPMVKILEETSIENLVAFLDASVMSENSDDDESSLASSNSFSEDDLKLELTPFQHAVYKSFKKWGGQKDIIFGAEIYLTVPAPYEWMRELIIQVLSRHEGLRTLVVDDGNKPRPRVIEDLSSVDILQLDSDDPNDIRKELIRMSDIPFNISKELPVRVICAHANGQFNLGFIFHSICFDLQSIQLFFSDFKQTALCKMKQSTAPPVPNVNLNREVKLALSPRMDELSEFWKERVNNDKPVSLISLSGKTEKSGEICGRHEYVQSDLTDEFRSKIDNVISKWNVTLFQFVASAYHLLLHLISGETRVSLRTSVDSRIHMPKLQSTITRCVNGIPLVSEVNPSQAIKTFITMNSREITQCVANGFYPGVKITENITEEHASNLGRHSVVSEDMTGLQSVSSGLEEFQFSFFSNGPMKINHETRLLIWSRKDKKNICLQLDYLPSLLSESKARAVLNSLLALVEYILANPQTPIKNIPGKMLLTAAMNGNASDVASTTGLASLTEKITGSSLTSVNGVGSNHIKGNINAPETRKQIPQSITSRKQEQKSDINHMSGIRDGKKENTYEVNLDQNDSNMLQSNEKSEIKQNLKAEKRKGIKKVSSKSSKSDFDPQLKAVLSGPILHMKNKNFSEKELETGSVSTGSYFMKTTKQGWQHKVYLKLDRDSLKWGQSPNYLTRQLPLESIIQISLNSVNDAFLLILKTKSRRFYFSTKDKEQAKSWMSDLRETLNKTVGQSPRLFVMAENFMLY